MAVKLEDSNMANYGTEEHKQMRTDAAGKEEAWQGVGKECGMLIWRIEKFQVIAWPKKQYGEFYDGDSYIILHTYKDPSSDTLKHNVHFWLGANTSQDEAGSAAYKTVELDDYLGQLPVQYRQVQAFESKEFIQLFDKISILSGGVESGFNHVEPESYEPRLLKVTGKCKKIQVYQVKMEVNALNSTDVFILDGGLKVYQYNGDKCNVWEKRKGNQMVDELQSERSIDNNDTAIIEGFGDSGAMVDAFWDHLGGKPDNMPPDIAPNDANSANEEKQNANVTPSVNRVNDDSGNVEITQVAKSNGKFKRSLLESKDCFIVDLGYSIYIWIGKASTKAEKREAMKYAVRYCMDSGRSTNTPIVRINEGNETEEFLSAFVSGSGYDKSDNNRPTVDKSNVKRNWNLSMSFEAKNREIQLRVIDQVTKQEFGKDINKSDVDDRDIVEVYKEIAGEVNNGNVKYTYDSSPPLIVDIGQYTFSCVGY
eukprot:547826_1